MTTTSSNQTPTVFAGLAGETAPGRVVNSGLYRMNNNDGQWSLLTSGLPEAPAVRAIAVHPKTPEVVYAGTQDGPYRSGDNGDHWEKVNVGDHGLPVWSLLFHPRDPDVMFAGYESSEIYRSDDRGEHWTQLPVSVRFPEVTVRPGANLAKRILMMSASLDDPGLLFGAIEVGGIIRSKDGGEHWENLSHGQYINDDPVDMHGVLASSFRPGDILGIGRAGMFRSEDQGDHWNRVQIDALNEKGQTYCRSIREAPGDSRNIWVSGGPNFQSDSGSLFHSSDGGANWRTVETGFEAHSTIFGLAFDSRNPRNMYCATSGGQVFGSQDNGQKWSEYPLPEGATQLYSLACT